MKIKSIKLKNFRGARREVILPADSSESILLYGDNGTGKSSFLDATEWFVTDKVAHLSGEEIEKHGGLRHALSSDDEESFVEFKFTSSLENTKKLEVKKDKLKASFINKDEAFLVALNEMRGERLWIRNDELVDFIIKSKSERLADISDIIGYDKVAKTKNVLKKSVNDLKKVLRIKNYEGVAAGKKGKIAEKLGQMVNTSEQFYAAINDLLIKNKIKSAVKCKESLKQKIEALKETTNEKELVFRQNLESISKKIDDFEVSVSSNLENFGTYQSEAQEIQKDEEGLKNISLVKLYSEANKILSHYEEDSCPLCLSEIKKDDLIEIIAGKLEALQQFNEKISNYNTTKESVLEILRQLLREINAIKESIAQVSDRLTIEQEELDKISTIETYIKGIVDEIGKNIVDIDLDKVKLDEDNLMKTFSYVATKLEEVTKNKKTEDNSVIIDLISNITIAEQAFEELELLEKEKSVLEVQLNTIEKITGDFNSKQKTEMSNFLGAISSNLNDFYLFMNEGERVDGIEITTVDDKDGEFAGIALKLKFHGEEITSPKKFLSESHINCLGLSLFLASVKLFNKKAKFIILDDVISSFDKPHRYRFAQLLLEKFSDYQLIVLTHEKDWFDLVSSQVKGLGWNINSTSWTEDDGTQIKVPLVTFREKIDKRISESDVDGLGNLLRIYAENILKELSSKLGAEFAFRFNERNEARTLDELYFGFKKRIKKKTDIADTDNVKRLENAKFFENKASHDGGYKENLSDLKPIYADLKAFEDTFKCTDGKCNKFVSLEYHNPTEGYVACKCGSKKLTWK